MAPQVVAPGAHPNSEPGSTGTGGLPLFVCPRSLHPIKALSANFEQDAFAKQVEDGAEEALGRIAKN